VGRGWRRCRLIDAERQLPMADSEFGTLSLAGDAPRAQRLGQRVMRFRPRHGLLVLPVESLKIISTALCSHLNAVAVAVAVPVKPVGRVRVRERTWTWGADPCADLKGMAAVFDCLIHISIPGSPHPFTVHLYPTALECERAIFWICSQKISAMNAVTRSVIRTELEELRDKCLSRCRGGTQTLTTAARAGSRPGPDSGHRPARWMWVAAQS